MKRLYNREMPSLSFSHYGNKFVKRNDFIPQSYYKLVTRCTGLVIKGAGIEVRNAGLEIIRGRTALFSRIKDLTYQML